MPQEFRELQDRRDGLRPPQFSLLVFLLFVGCVAGLVSLGLRGGAPAALAATLALLTMVVHVFSTAIGSQLHSGRPRPTARDGDSPPIRQPTSAGAEDFAKATQLGDKRALQRRPLLVWIVSGACLAASLGTFVLALVMWHDLSLMNWLLGAASSAVLGGMVGFWLGSLLQVAREALNEAQEER